MPPDTPRPEEPDAQGPAAGRGARPWALAAMTVSLVVGLDQATKALVVASVAPGERIEIFLGLELTHVRNTGIAFGALAGGGAAVAVLTVTALGLLLVYFGRHARTPLLWLPVGMLLGGALGNVVDRARQGAVTDFIDPVAWPAFNLADAAIVVGVLGLLYVAEGRKDR